MGGNAAASTGPSIIGSTGQSININMNLDEASATSGAETLLSSNARFQAISAIAVTQDGVINVADQGWSDINYHIPNNISNLKL